MNLRILKKLSQRAASYLPLLGDKREQFAATEGENYHGLVIHARKHWERCESVHADTFSRDEIVLAPRCRAGTRLPFIKLRPPHHPWPGTIMVGSIEGYYEPEWSEETAWGALDGLVRDHFFDYQAERLTRRLHGPSDIFKAADEMIAAASDAARERGL